MSVKFAHIHIPKTAGTSVTAYMRKILGNKRVAHFGGRHRKAIFENTSAKELSQYRCIGGHIVYPEFVKKLGRNPVYFSIVRNPEDRFLSFYKDISQRASHPLHDLAKKTPLIDFLHRSYDNGYIRHQTLYLSRNDSFAGAKRLIKSGDILVQPLEAHDLLLSHICRLAEKTPIELPQRNVSKKVDMGQVDWDEYSKFIHSYFSDDVALYDFVKSYRKGFM